MPVSFIPTLDLDPRFCYLRDKNRSFDAGVPIRLPSGINIGVYCVLRVDQDISMPIMDGLESTRRTREFERANKMTPPMTVIALTGLSGEGNPAGRVR